MSTAKTISLDADGDARRARPQPVGPTDDEIVGWARQQALRNLEMIIQKIWRRVRSHSLDRGLSLSLPYFDDGAMEIRQWEMEVIPRGRVQFVPAFVVLAVRRERARLQAATVMSDGTRRHLTEILEILEREFGGAAPEASRRRLAE